MQSTNLPRMLIYGAGAGLATFLVLGITTTIIPNPVFPREEAVRVVDYVILATITLLATALGSTYAIPHSCPLDKRSVFSGGVFVSGY